MQKASRDASALVPDLWFTVTHGESVIWGSGSLTFITAMSVLDHGFDPG
jgi:hypothetical protein